MAPVFFVCPQWTGGVMIQYLDKKIVQKIRTNVPKWGIGKDGYTLNSGAPSSIMILLENEKRFRRVMYWCFSNTATFFVKINGNELCIPEHMLD